MEGHVILSSLMFRLIKGFVQSSEETINNNHSINVTFFWKTSIQNVINFNF